MIQEIAMALQSGFSRRSAPITPSGPVGLDKIDNFLDWLVGFSSDNNNWAGAAVTSSSAMRITGHWACVNIISSALAQLPIITYQINPDTGEKARAPRHYLYNLLRHEVNEYMSAFRFKRLMQGWLCNQGNAIAYMEFNDRYQLSALWPWRPDRVEMKPLGKIMQEQNVHLDGIQAMDPGEPFYRYRGGDGSYTAWEPWFNILHIRGLESDGFWGLSPIEVHRQTMSLALAMQEYTARFYGNGGRPLGVISHPGVLKDPEKLRASWQKIHGGPSNAHKIAILEEAMTYKEIGLKQSDAQYVETANLSITDFCRIHNVPPHKLAELTGSGASKNIEWQGMEWLQDGLGPWISNWEAELQRSILSPRERQTIEVEFYINALMRTDAAGRSAYYAKALGGAPWMFQDEVRRLESLNPSGIPDAAKFPVTNNAPGPVPKGAGTSTDGDAGAGGVTGDVDEGRSLETRDGWVTLANGSHVNIGSDEKNLSAKQKASIASRNPCGKDKQDIAEKGEAKLSRAIGIPRTRDNSAFDLRNDDVGIEVKTMVDGKNDKITMSKSALGRKLAEASAEGLKTFTVVADVRGGGSAKYYISDKLGSIRLGSMKATTLSEIKDMVRL